MPSTSFPQRPKSTGYGPSAMPRNGATPAPSSFGTGLSQRPIFDPQLFTRRDKWREYFNPLWQLSIPLVVARLQASQIGIVSDIQWIYRFIERRNPTMIALIQRRLSALSKLEWDIKVLPESMIPDGYTVDDAEAQRVALRDSYDQIDNLEKAIAALAMATFRGYAHLEKHYDKDGNVVHLEPVPQWNWARDGLFGSWWYNEGAISTFAGGSNTVPIDADDFIIREYEYPVDEVAVIAFIRKNIALRDWDSFIASYGVPPLFIEMPQGVPPELQDAYQAAAERVASNTQGVLPSGAKVQTISEAGRGVNPFKTHIDYLDAQIVLAGTGGKLTMLTESGSGTLAGNAHSDTFDEIGLSEANEITEIFQKQHDEPILEKQFPGQPILAYFEIAAKEQEDTSGVVKNVLSLAQAGYEPDIDQLQEITGLTLKLRPPIDKAVLRAVEGNPGIQGTPGNDQTTSNRAWRWLKNRIWKKTPQAETQDALLANSGKLLSPIQAEQLKALAARYKAEVLTGSDDGLLNRNQAFMATLPAELAKLKLDPRKAKILTDTFAAASLNGVTNS